MFYGITGFGVIMFFFSPFFLPFVLSQAGKAATKLSQSLERRDSAQGLAEERVSVRQGGAQAQ